jgi:hypothetical protein
MISYTLRESPAHFGKAPPIPGCHGKASMTGRQGQAADGRFAPAAAAVPKGILRDSLRGYPPGTGCFAELYRWLASPRIIKSQMKDEIKYD